MLAKSSSWFYNPYVKDLLERFVLGKKFKFRIEPQHGRVLLWEELPPGFRGLELQNKLSRFVHIHACTRYPVTKERYQWGLLHRSHDDGKTCGV
jgi:hypothetical protein